MLQEQRVGGRWHVVRRDVRNMPLDNDTEEKTQKDTHTIGLNLSCGVWRPAGGVVLDIDPGGFGLHMVVSLYCRQLSGRFRTSQLWKHVLKETDFLHLCDITMLEIIILIQI